ncbi:fumarate hydratase subunit alpha [Humitalea rosea]|uniref:Fumarate hydratase subunit alpha n=1 Tax=Humitalea rosea TaxID=990373 RepID=A0A2W7IH05_9PROT|nr:fumarate hydratase [Humitalea rosea]PZW45954.1 fumarate hydratase subunit alpha [Humitalea rosea]
MPITYDLMRQVTAQLYSWSLKKVPDDTLEALRLAQIAETHPGAKRTLQILLKSAIAAETSDRLVCSDSGVPVYFVQLGTATRLEGDIKRAIRDGFDELVRTHKPPLLKHVTNPLTNERGYHGKDMPLITWDVMDGADYVEITCQPKALGSGRWAALEIFSFPTLETIEAYVMDCVLKAGSQHCPPVLIGVGIGGSFDTAAKLAKLSTLRKLGSVNPEPILQAMEERLTIAVNKTGFGPMGTGGDTTTLGVHVDYASGHGFTPVAVCFNCWINRRTRARIYDDGRVERLE